MRALETRGQELLHAAILAARRARGGAVAHVVARVAVAPGPGLRHSTQLRGRVERVLVADRPTAGSGWFIAMRLPSHEPCRAGDVTPSSKAEKRSYVKSARWGIAESRKICLGSA